MVVLLVGSAEANQKVIDVEGQEWEVLRNNIENRGKILPRGIISCIVCQRPLYAYIHIDDFEHMEPYDNKLPKIPFKGSEWFVSCPYCGANVIKEVPNRAPLYLTTKGWKSVKD